MPLPDDDELLEQLRRVSSDFTFRRRTRRLIAFIAAVIAVNLVVSILAVTAFFSVRHQQDRADADRAERSRGSCIQFNINQFNTREAIIGGLVDTFRPLVQPGREAELNQFATSLRTNVERLLPYRACTDDAIEEFLKHPPQDPNSGG